MAKLQLSFDILQHCGNCTFHSTSTKQFSAHITKVHGGTQLTAEGRMMHTCITIDLSLLCKITHHVHTRPTTGVTGTGTHINTKAGRRHAII